MGAKTYVRDGIEYTASNHRMKYHPEYHENHGKPYTLDDLIYMCSMWDSMKKAEIALALGKTHSSVLNKVHDLRKQGMFKYYKSLGERQLRD